MGGKQIDIDVYIHVYFIKCNCTFIFIQMGMRRETEMAIHWRCMQKENAAKNINGQRANVKGIILQKLELTE